MKTKLIYPVVLMVVFAAACGGDDGRKSADQAAYETVQEGSASGVTSTIHGPGETLPPITGTNADTTTAFTLNPNVAPGGTPATVAGTLPAPTPVYGGTSAGGGTYTPQQPVTRATPSPQPQQPRQVSVPQQPVTATPSAPQPQPAQPATQPQPQPEPAPAEPTESGPTDTATTQAPPTSTNTAPPPQEKLKQEPKQNEPAPPPPSEQGEEPSEEEPPPPPPPANTR